MAHARLRIGAALVLLAAAGCASTPPPSPSIPQVLDQVSRAGLTKAGEIIEQSLKEQETFGYVAPFAPVVLPPEIRRVWILTHVSPDGTLVSGHWVYLRLHDWRWFIETEAVPLRLGSGPAAPAIAPGALRPTPRSGDALESAMERRRAPASPPLPWVEGARGEGTPPQPSDGERLEEGSSVPTVPIPAPLVAPPVAPHPGGSSR